MKYHSVYFIFLQAGSHNMPLNKPLRIEFNSWESLSKFTESGYLEKEGGTVLAITGHKKPKINPIAKKELQKEIPNVDGVLKVELLYTAQGIKLFSAVNN